MKRGYSEARLTRKTLRARRASGVWPQRIIAGGESAPSAMDRPSVAVSFHSCPNRRGGPSALMEGTGSEAAEPRPRLKVRLDSQGVRPNLTY